jgi:hypothetical protein
MCHCFHAINRWQLIHYLRQILQHQASVQVWILLPNLHALVAVTASYVDKEGCLYRLWLGKQGGTGFFVVTQPLLNILFNGIVLETSHTKVPKSRGRDLPSSLGIPSIISQCIYNT